MMTSFLPTDIAELICTRISHDLIGNIGAISNAMELLNEDPSDISDIKPLLENSSSLLAARMKFFRLAFGLKNAAPKEIGELNDIINAYLLTLGNPKTPIMMKSNLQNISLYKIVMLSIMALSDVFVRGGEIRVKETDDALSFEAVSDFDLSVSKLENIERAMEGVIPEENPALLAPIVYLLSFLKESGIKISLKYKANQAFLSVK